MHNLKKWLMGVFAVLLAAAALVPATAMAEDTYSITITEPTGHAGGYEYQAYKIFGGDVATLDGSTVLANIVWGNGVSADGQAYFGDADAKAKTLTDDNAASFATELAPYLATVAGTSTDNGTSTYVINVSEPGYYLVKSSKVPADVEGSNPGTDTNNSGAYTSYILQVLGNVSVNAKSDVPNFTKKLKDINDSTDDAASDWQDSADYDLGDDVPFKLEANLPGNVSAYKTYYFAFEDTMSKGLTYNNDLAVFIGNEQITEGYTVTSTTAEDGTTSLSIVFSDIKSCGGTDNSVVRVEFSAKLNDQSVMGSAGNPNEARIFYSNNPNDNGEGRGESPKDKVIVFTYNVNFNKVDKDTAKALTGAQFTLYKYNKKSDSWDKVGTNVVNEAGDLFTWNRIDDGKYKLVEDKAPAGYNKMDDLEFEVSASHDATSDNPELRDLTATFGANKVNGDTGTGSITTKVENEKGSILPTTGGAGTVALYVVGGALVAACVCGLGLYFFKRVDR